MKKIGYPCQNWSEKLTTGHSFKLKSYSEEKLKAVVASNISDLKKMLAYNIKNKISFLRLSSGFVPFASHPICKYHSVNFIEFNLAKLQLSSYATMHTFCFGNKLPVLCINLQLLRALRPPIIFLAH
jgi:UV DNA damage repair endonuclease